MENNSYAAQFKSLQFIYGALIIGVLVFSTVVYFYAENLHFAFDGNSMYGMLVPMLAIVALITSPMLFKGTLNSINPQDELSTKITKYQSANIIRGAILEVPALLGAAITLSTGNYYFLVFSLLMIVAMIFAFPSKQKFMETVQLSFGEKSKLK